MTIRIDAAQVEKLAARGLTAEVIADFIGVPRDTFAASMKDDATVEAAWRRGRANLQMKTMEWLVISARKGSVQAQIYLADRVFAAGDAGADPHDDPHDQARRVRDALRAMQAVENDGVRYVVEIPPELPEAEWVAAYSNTNGLCW
jgi:acetylornithine deacetylase/succinyl-diaminopimelate desuccinylase-like protein